MASEPIAQEFRRCSRCGNRKPANKENFSFIRSKGKWHPWCKPCCAEDRRRDRAERPEHYAEIGRRCRERNPDRFRELQRARYDPAKNKIASASRTVEQKDRYNTNRRIRKQTDKRYAEKVRQQQRETMKRHGEKYKAQRRAAWADAPASKRLRTYFTSAICHSLKGSTKGGRSWETILGYTAVQLREHLERQFERGMTWDNYGDWHVDHIVPVASFDFSSADDPEFHACWALTNLRPMWGVDNIKKSDKRLHLL